MSDILHNYSILFVDDNDNIRKNYIDVLQNKFSKVYEAKDGLIVYEIYSKMKPDIMIVDVDLPKMNGLEFLSKVRNNDLNTKVILFTSYSDKATLLKASVLKLTQCLIKPVSRKELYNALLLAIQEIRNFNISTKNNIDLKDNYSWDFINSELYCHKIKIDLSKRQKDILKIIFDNGVKNSITIYDELLYSLWGCSDENSLKSLKTYISTIRKKLPSNTILNEYGQGYRLSYN